MRVVIAGAGIAGLALALRLRQQGLAPVVVERSPKLRDGGYTLGLSDPGFDAAEGMGVADALQAARHIPRRGGCIGQTGRERSTIDSRKIDRASAARAAATKVPARGRPGPVRQPGGAQPSPSTMSERAACRRRLRSGPYSGLL